MARTTVGRGWSTREATRTTFDVGRRAKVGERSESSSGVDAFEELSTRGLTLANDGLRRSTIDAAGRSERIEDFLGISGARRSEDMDFLATSTREAVTIETDGLGAALATIGRAARERAVVTGGALALMGDAGVANPKPSVRCFIADLGIAGRADWQKVSTAQRVGFYLTVIELSEE